MLHRNLFRYSVSYINPPVVRVVTSSIRLGVQRPALPSSSHRAGRHLRAPPRRAGRPASVRRRLAGAPPPPLRVLPPLRIPRGESARRLAVKTWDRQRGRRARDGHWGAGAHYLSVRSTILCRLLVIAIAISDLIKSYVIIVRDMKR